MSGSGGVGGGGGIGVGGFQPACENLIINTQLSSPKDDVITRISVGDVLDLKLVSVNGTAVVHVLYQGQVAGGIASAQVSRLRECMQQGTNYVANVISSSGGQVRIQIFARQ